MNGMMSNGHEKEEGERCNVMVPDFDGSRAKNNRKAKELEERESSSSTSSTFNVEWLRT